MHKKLSHDQRMFVLRMSGEGYRLADIQRELNSKYNISLHHESIKSTCEAKINQPFVQQFRESYLARVKEVPIANKRIRVDDLEKVRKKIIEQIEKNPMETAKQKSEFLLMTNRLERVIEQAREEMEKKPQLIASVAVNEFTSLSDAELLRRKDSLIQKILGFQQADVVEPDSDDPSILD